MGDGRAAAPPADVRRALHLFVLACLLVAAVLLLLAWSVA
jgi:cobalamin biosynthesis protein CobD/CbiB